MLFRPKLLRVFLGQPADDGERGQLWLHNKPVLDRGNVRVEFGRHANPCLIRPLEASMGGARIAGLHRGAERLRKRDRVQV
jgi:hypothetical protein